MTGRLAICGELGCRSSDACRRTGDQCGTDINRPLGSRGFDPWPPEASSMSNRCKWTVADWGTDVEKSPRGMAAAVKTTGAMTFPFDAMPRLRETICSRSTPEAAPATPPTTPMCKASRTYHRACRKWAVIDMGIDVKDATFPAIRLWCPTRLLSRPTIRWTPVVFRCTLMRVADRSSIIRLQCSPRSR